MYYKSGNTLIKSGATFFKQEIKTLTFQVDRDVFPFVGSSGQLDNNIFGFRSTGANTVTVNWGDGTSDTHDFIQDGSDYAIYWKGNGNTDGLNVGRHYFQDENTGDRFISFEFDKPELINEQDSYWTLLRGVYPEDAVNFPALNYIRVQSARQLTGFPTQLGGGVTYLNLQSALLSKYNQIPDAFFGNPLDTLVVTNCYNLSDVTSSNFFKINQLKETLRILYIIGCNVSNFPSVFNELENLEILYAYGNDFEDSLPFEVENISSFTQLRLGNNGQNLINSDLIDHANHNLITTLQLSFPNLDYSQIPTKWSGLKSLNSIDKFIEFCINNDRFNAFIPYFYQLVIANGFVDPTSQAAIASGYPYQFRSITWGHSSLNVDTPIQAPAGFTPGVFFGNAQTNGERVYEMGVNYAHVIN